MRSRFVIPLLLLALGVCFVSVSQPVYAHFCDDHYVTEQDRAACWWRYWNDQSTETEQAWAVYWSRYWNDQSPEEDGQETAMTSPAATSVSASMLALPGSGESCDTLYTTQQDKEDCWWRYHQSLADAMSPTSMSMEAVSPVSPEEDGQGAAMTSPAATSVSASMLALPGSGESCDTLYTTQQDKEDCWWRYHQSLAGTMLPTSMSMEAVH